MSLRRFFKVGLSACLFLGMINSVSANTSKDDESYREPVGDEVLYVDWCEVGQFATGYAINLGYYSNGSSTDPNIMSAYKGYLPGKCYDDYYDAVNAARKLDEFDDEQVPIVAKVTNGSQQIVWTSYGVVYLENSKTSLTYPLYESNSTDSAKVTYINATSQRDALILNVTSEGWAKVMMAGAEGYLKLTNSSGTYIHEIIPITQLDKTTSTYDDVSFYGYRLTRFGVHPTDTTSVFMEVLRGSNNSYLSHSGKAEKPSFMKASNTYYSYDEHYFYDNLMDMIDDYRSASYKHALNYKEPYYNYYQYIPARSKSLLNGDDFNQYLISVKPSAGDKVTYCYTSSGSSTSCSGSYAYKYEGPSSILYDNGDAFLEGQNYYGINATMIYVKAVLEGAYGQSTLSRAKYNPFGVNAVDSAPFSSATKYKNVFEGVEAQFQTLMSLGYANPYDVKGRYNGSQTGNKGSGQNTMYASDPAWGWKLASLYRDIDAVSGYLDLNYYQLGITNTSDVVVYADEDLEEEAVVLKNYVTLNSYDFSGKGISVIVVDSFKKNGKKIYKIVLDRPSDQSEGYYYWSEDDYGYVYADEIDLINEAKKGYRDPKDIGDNLSSVKMETFETPVIVTTNANNTKLYDTYRTDITPTYTTVGSDISFVTKRSVTINGKKYFEVIIDYTTASYRTRYILASDVSIDKKGNVVITTASNVNTRPNPNTSGNSIAQIKQERAPLVYLGSVDGQEINGNSTWYRVVVDPINDKTGYISAAYSTCEAANAEVSTDKGVDDKKVTTENYVVSMLFNNTLFLNGLGIVAGVETPNMDDISYCLRIISMEDGTTYLYPLESVVSAIELNEALDYSYSWYEGNVALNKVLTEDGKEKALPSGQYDLEIEAVTIQGTNTFQLYNKKGLELADDIEVKKGMTYSMKQTKSGVLYLEVTNDKTELDLSPYSNMDMDVYMNSRVTSIKMTNTGFKVEGYMWEAHTNCNKKNSIWREIVFVSSEDTSTASAYRLQVTPTYNTWLNSNKFATDDYKYKLDYANYYVNVNPNAIYTYADGQNKNPVKMASGEYYVYMRISNGKASYLFPLRDVTLSDGTNMENTGTLPEGFSIWDSESRAMTYTVK